MKLFTRPKCFTDAIALNITLHRLLGIRIFEYPHGQPRPILSLIYLLLLYAIHCGAFNLQDEYYADMTLLKLETFLYKILMTINTCSVLIKLILGWWYTKSFEVCYKKISEIDETLRQIGLVINYDIIYFVTIGVMITGLIFTIITSALVSIHLHNRVNLYTSIYMIVAYTYALFVNGIVIFDFYILVKYLQMRFELVNQFLYEHSGVSSTKKRKLGFFEMQDYANIMNCEQRKRLSTKMLSRWRRQTQPQINISVLEKSSTVKSQIQTQFQKELQNQSQRHNPVMTKCEKRKHLLQTIKQVHLELCKMSKTICTILGVQAAFDVAASIMFLTGMFYNLYNRYVVQQDKFVKTLTEQTAVSVILCTLTVVKIIFLSRICKKASDEGNKTIEIIYGIYGCEADIDMRCEIQQFGIQILQSPITFSAFGLSLGNNVISLGLRTVTTYLVIMIQVSNSLESNKAIKLANI
ncbi:gustatory receptor for bitter taste 66a-like [Linepithema humile]|uniref:gustatory receptor for bitter taste 66a-like n=1 Tax=Linepithema humile TaxID=83485 RepID=UPI0006232C23|nr:PREDICTED: uncharacterized protein LOC105674149 [Linepithema humile]